jgi:hypothetical protein
MLIIYMYMYRSKQKIDWRAYCWDWNRGELYTIHFDVISETCAKTNEKQREYLHNKISNNLNDEQVVVQIEILSIWLGVNKKKTV